MHRGFSKLIPVLLAALIAALGIHALIHHGGEDGFALSGESFDGENESDENESSDNENESSDDSDGIDCSIPDNQDDSGCDTGDREGSDNGDEGDDSDDDDDTDDVESDDQESRALLPPPPEPRPPLPAEGRAAPLEHPRAADVDTGPAPRGSVATGAGGMAR